MLEKLRKPRMDLFIYLLLFFSKSERRGSEASLLSTASEKVVTNVFPQRAHFIESLFLTYAQSRVPHDQSYISHVVRKPAFCICENKDADQLRGNLSKSEISSL